MDHPIEVGCLRWIVLLPLMGAALNGILGSRIQERLGRGATIAIACVPVTLSFVLAVSAFVQLLGLEPSHMVIDLRVDPPARTATGSVALTVVARADGQTTLSLNAVALDDVLVADVDGHELSWSYDDEHVEICWAEAPAAGETRGRLQAGGSHADNARPSGDRLG